MTQSRTPTRFAPGLQSAKSNGTHESLVPPGSEATHHSAGRPLDEAARTILQPHFGHDFSRVRVHIGPRADDAARGLGAAAFTLGNDVVFGNGYYEPHSGRGLRLLAHELAHVVQSQNVAPRGANPDGGRPDTDALEAEAEQVSEGLGQNKIAVRRRLSQPLTLCHPIYISAHGDQGYLDKAAQFYTSWGYSPIQRGVKSIEAVVKDLAGKSSIDQVTIVSHAHPQYVHMQFVDNGPETVLKSDWEADSVQNLVKLERHLVDPTVVDQLMKYVEISHPGLLAQINAATDPVAHEFVWWTIEVIAVQLSNYGALQFGMTKVAQDNADRYRNRLLAAHGGSGSAGSGQATVTSVVLTAVESVVTAEASRWPWGQVKLTFQQKFEAEQRLKESPSAEVHRIMDKPDFLQNLALVRKQITNSSKIEIKGCSVGKDPDYLRGIQKFFGGSAKPTVTAPDWFQAFGPIGFTAIPNTEREASKQWSDKNVQAALAFWYTPITGNKLPPKLTHATLLDYLRQGHVLPLAVPGAVSNGTLLMLQGKLGEKAFLDWLTRHSYRLTATADLQRAFFVSGNLATSISTTILEWLQEYLSGPTEMIFRPSPNYDKHIIKVT